MEPEVVKVESRPRKMFVSYSWSSPGGAHGYGNLWVSFLGPLSMDVVRKTEDDIHEKVGVENRFLTVKVILLNMVYLEG
jgi:hypothetical protein